jgi:hypothetical protein
VQIARRGLAEVRQRAHEPALVVVACEVRHERDGRRERQALRAHQPTATPGARKPTHTDVIPCGMLYFAPSLCPSAWLSPSAEYFSCLSGQRLIHAATCNAWRAARSCGAALDAGSSRKSSASAAWQRNLRGVGTPGRYRFSVAWSTARMPPHRARQGARVCAPEPLGRRERELGVEDDARGRELRVPDGLLAPVLVSVSAADGVLGRAERRRYRDDPREPGTIPGALLERVRHDLARVYRAPAADGDEHVRARARERVGARADAADRRVLADVRERGRVRAVRGEHGLHTFDHVRLRGVGEPEEGMRRERGEPYLVAQGLAGDDERALRAERVEQLRERGFETARAVYRYD